MAPRQLAMPVNNFRQGRRRRISLLAIHTTEGARTMGALVAFQRRMGNSSYHAGSDDELIGYMVNRANEAWHLRNGNPMSDGFVLCGMAEWPEAEWHRHPVMLENCAWWIASAARERGLPLRWMTIEQVAEAVRNPSGAPGGVCMHWDYTRATGDGTHWDCGRNLPKEWIINRARQIQSGQVDAGLPTKPPIVNTSEDLVALIDIRPGADGTFRHAAMAEAGSSSQVVERAWITYGSTWGATRFTITSLKADGTVMGPPHTKDVANNRSGSVELPDGVHMVTVEGKASGSVPAAALVVKAK